MALVNGTTALLMLDGIHALYRVDDLNGRADADAIDDAGDAAALLVAAFRPHVLVLVLASVDFAHAVAGTLPNGTAGVRFGDFDRIGTAGGRADVGFGTHGDALDAAVDAEAALLASVVPPIALDVLDVLVDARLRQMLTLVDGAALALGNVAHRDAAVGARRSERRRAALRAVDVAGAAVAAQLASVVEDLLVFVLLALVLAGRAFLADPNVAAALLVLDLLGMRTFGRGRQID